MMLQLTNIHKTFNPNTVNEKKALNGLCVSVKESDFITIIGSNGAGKSTLFSAIAGTFLPDKGKIEIDGKNVTYQADYRRSSYIGRMFQDPLRGTAPNLTIEENLGLAFIRSKKNSGIFSYITKADRALFKDKLSQLELGLEDRLDSPVGLLSGGQRQALTLLMATIVPPKILLLDEHTAALDPPTAKKVLDITKQTIKENNLTCLMITHNLSDALLYGNRTFMMDSGNIILDITGEERKNMTIPTLLDSFKSKAQKALDNDRILLS